MDTRKPDRITWRYIFKSILEVFNFERGFFYTLRELAFRPGVSIRKYLFESRELFVKPFPYFLLTVTIAIILVMNVDPMTTKVFNSGFEHFYEEPKGGDKALNQRLAATNQLFAEKYFPHFIQNQQLMYWFLLPIMSIITWLFFRRERWFYTEHLVMNTYLAGFQNIVYLLLMPIAIWIGGEVYYGIYLTLSLSYLFYAYYHIFSSYSGFSRYVRSFLSMIMGTLSFMFMMVVILVAAYLYIFVYLVPEA